MKVITFSDCNCKLEYNNQDGIILDMDNIDYNCQQTWQSIHTGKTCGIFQLESSLGSIYAAKLKPENINELALLLAIIRPGCLDVIIDSKSITEHVIDRKHSREECTIYHKSLEPSLKSTYNMLIFQEQTMQLVCDTAGFDLKMCDDIRRAMGKKDTILMEEVKQKFLKGCVKTKILSPDESEEVFRWIYKSSRYNFNRSHAVSYSVNAYNTMWIRQHWPLQFFCSYLRHTKTHPKPQEQINFLVSDAKERNIQINPPDLRHMHSDFTIHENEIYFGITSLKGIGESVHKRLTQNILPTLDKYDINIKDITWIETLVHILANINSTASLAFINSGALLWLKLSRTWMRHQYNIFQKLTKREQKVVTLVIIQSRQGNGKSVPLELVDIFKSMAKEPAGKGKPCSNKNRVEAIKSLISLLEDPPYSMLDRPGYISGIEKSIMGVSLTHHSIDECDTSSANCDCKDFHQLKPNKNNILFIAATINSVNQIKTKKGKNPGQEMAFLSVEDGTGQMDMVTFPEPWKENSELLWENNTILFQGVKNKDSFFVEKCYQL